ncbi:MAG: DUF3795 domain-containing protein [Candidatus Lokiarchaeota archaeon]|nr:DUF3795 domain-containing protein [Candidatus Lokiarchaeota archaeon]
MIKDYKITTCGLSCDLCDANTTKIQDQAKYLLRVFEDPMFLGILSMTNPEFNIKNIPPFKEVLDILMKFMPCPGCEDRGDCPINSCAREKNISDCSACKFIDVENEICAAPPEPSKMPFMPPAPIFFNGISKRYKKWNLKNLKLMKDGKKSEINKEIESMIKKDKSNRDLIDTTVNLFNQMKENPP